MKKFFIIFAVLAAGLAFSQEAEQVGASPGPGVRYATDAYPGFDYEHDVISPTRKEPKWFGWINGPDCENAADQFVRCRELEGEENWSRAIRQYDALVRAWPTAPEAPVAQRRMAELLEEKEDDLPEAFEEYLYLIDFYSFRCDHEDIMSRLYRLARQMRERGRTIVFLRFDNTVEVRRAFENCILRAPGAEWAPAAMLEIGTLRENEGKYSEAVKVYENLRNLHASTPEARLAVMREADARMHILDSFGYNRSIGLDTAAFLDMARNLVDAKDVQSIDAHRARVGALLEDEAYRAAMFYDTRMRTRRSAINAYERFLIDYPQSTHAEEIRARLEALKGTEK